MSVDAKVWKDKDDPHWRGGHDGPCHDGKDRTAEHRQGDYYLSDLLKDIEACSGKLRWEFRIYPDGQVGLVGYFA